MTEIPSWLNYVAVQRARNRIAPYIRHTPLEPSHALSQLTGAKVFLKLESLQVTGSFKPRISFNKLLSLDEVQRRRGVVASTAGGHGIGLSYAAQKLGIPADIFLPHTADPQKIETLKRQGARLRFFDSVETARLAAQQEATERDLVFVSAYNDPEIVAGGGTVGLEILQDLPQVDLLLVGMGGGGLISGMSIVLKTVNPQAQVWGVQPEANPVLVTWLQAGKPVPLDISPSIADGLGAYIEEDSLTFPLTLKYLDRTLLVTEDEIKEAMAWMLEEHQMVVEPSGAAPIAALLKARPQGFANIAVVITGRNINRTRYLELLGESMRGTR